jgi:hypothetical protein
MNPDDLIHLCREAAGRICGTRPPSARYAESVARLLAGTAAAESLLKWRRQQPPSVFPWTSLKGAWGLWQTEHLAVGDSVKYLRRRTDVQDAAVRFAPRMAEALLLETLPLMQLIHDDDAVAVTFARLHYLRVAEAVPDDLRGQAGYWKRYYNTRLGKGTVEGYMDKFTRYVEPAL